MKSVLVSFKLGVTLTFDYTKAQSPGRNSRKFWHFWRMSVKFWPEVLETMLRHSNILMYIQQRLKIHFIQIKRFLLEALIGVPFLAEPYSSLSTITSFMTPITAYFHIQIWPNNFQKLRVKLQPIKSQILVFSHLCWDISRYLILWGWIIKLESFLLC